MINSERTKLKDLMLHALAEDAQFRDSLREWLLQDSSRSSLGQPSPVRRARRASARQSATAQDLLSPQVSSPRRRSLLSQSPLPNTTPESLSNTPEVEEDPKLPAPPSSPGILHVKLLWPDLVLSPRSSHAQSPSDNPPQPQDRVSVKRSLSFGHGLSRRGAGKDVPWEESSASESEKSLG